MVNFQFAIASPCRTGLPPHAVTALVDDKQFQAAITVLNELAEGDPTRRDMMLYQVAALHVAKRDLAAYRNLCAQLFEQYQHSESASDLNLLCWVLCYTADSHPELRSLTDKAATILTKDPDNPKNRPLLNTAGCFLYRAGRYEEALKWLDASMKSLAKGEGDPFDWVFAAMAHHRLGRPEEVRKWLDKTKIRFAEAIEGKAKAPTEQLWRVKLEFLIREAEAVLGAAPKVDSSPQQKAG